MLTYVEILLLNSIFTETLENSQDLERRTIGQDKNNIWLQERSKRITSSKAYQIFTRKRNFETLANSLKSSEKLPKFVQDAMKHGKEYEAVAKQKCFDYMTYVLKRNVKKDHHFG